MSPASTRHPRHPPGTHNGTHYASMPACSCPAYLPTPQASTQMLQRAASTTTSRSATTGSIWTHFSLLLHCSTTQLRMPPPGAGGLCKGAACSAAAAAADAAECASSARQYGMPAAATACHPQPPVHAAGSGALTWSWWCASACVHGAALQIANCCFRGAGVDCWCNTGCHPAYMGCWCMGKQPFG